MNLLKDFLVKFCPQSILVFFLCEDAFKLLTRKLYQSFIRFVH